MFTAVLFTIVKTCLEATQMSIKGEWIRKLRYIHTMEYYSARKKNTFDQF